MSNPTAAAKEPACEKPLATYFTDRWLIFLIAPATIWALVTEEFAALPGWFEIGLAATVPIHAYIILAPLRPYARQWLGRCAKLLLKATGLLLALAIWIIVIVAIFNWVAGLPVPVAIVIAALIIAAATKFRRN